MLMFWRDEDVIFVALRCLIDDKLENPWRSSFRGIGSFGRDRGGVAES